MVSRPCVWLTHQDRQVASGTKASLLAFGWFGSGETWGMIDPTDGANPEKRNIVDDALQGSTQVNGSPAAVDLPILRAAYSDRTAALMARLAEFAYDDETAQE